MTTLFVDCDVLNFAVDKRYAEQLGQYIKGLALGRTLITVCHYTKYEFFRGLYKGQKYRDGIALMKGFKPVGVESITWKTAVELSSCYSFHPETKKKTSISDGDIFVGALAMKTSNGAVLTGDRMDYPTPFFTEVDGLTLHDIKAKRDRKVYILQPDRDIFEKTAVEFAKQRSI